VKTIAGDDGEQVRARVRAKLQSYLENVRAAFPNGNEHGGENVKNSSLFKGLPQKYHESLMRVIEDLDKVTTQGHAIDEGSL
jgi:hypothetical protein